MAATAAGAALDPSEIDFAYRPTRGRHGEPRLVFTVSYPAHPAAAQLIRQAVGNLLAPLRDGGPSPAPEVDRGPAT